MFPARVVEANVKMFYCQNRELISQLFQWEVESLLCSRSPCLTSPSHSILARYRLLVWKRFQQFTMLTADRQNKVLTLKKIHKGCFESYKLSLLGKPSQFKETPSCLRAYYQQGPLVSISCEHACFQLQKIRLNPGKIRRRLYLRLHVPFLCLKCNRLRCDFILTVQFLVWGDKYQTRRHKSLRSESRRWHLLKNEKQSKYISEKRTKTVRKPCSPCNMKDWKSYFHRQHQRSACIWGRILPSNPVVFKFLYRDPL